MSPLHKRLLKAARRSLIEATDPHVIDWAETILRQNPRPTAMNLKAQSEQARRELLTSQAALFSREDGVSAPELIRLLQATESPLRRMLHALVESGDLFAAGGVKSIRYFSSKAAAGRFIAPKPIRPKPKIASPSFKSQVVDTSGLTVTVCPSGRDTRFAVAPEFVGSFVLAGIGRDVETGRPWRTA